MKSLVKFNKADIIQTDGVIDKKYWNVIQELQRPDQANILHKLIHIYLENTPDLIELLAQATDDMDEITFSETAHTIKSSSRNLGAIKLAQLCEKCECNSKEKDQSKAVELVNEIKKEYQLVETALSKELEH